MRHDLPVILAGFCGKCGQSECGQQPTASGVIISPSSNIFDNILTGYGQQPLKKGENMPPSQQLTIEQAISRAKEAAEQGDIAAAQQLYSAVLQHQPNHPIATQELRKLQ